MHSDHLEATKISMKILEEAVNAVKIGSSGTGINELVGDLCKKHDVEPAFLGVGDSSNPFPANLCVSVNDEVLHAIPSNVPFKAGDLVKVDFGIVHKGFYTDHCVTIGLEPVAEIDRNLMRIGKLAVENAVAKAVAGNTVGDLGHSMQSTVELAGFNVLKNFVGHGIGKNLHLPPEIAAYGQPGHGARLKKGMVVCVEAQVVAGSDRVKTAEDGWTITTLDGSRGVMFEYMVEVGRKGNEILTDTRNWQIFK